MVVDTRVPLVGHRLDPHGPRGRPARGQALRPRLLELGGNNAGIVCPTADLDMALRAIAFGRWARPASAAPRCAACSCMTASTTLVPRLKKAYESVEGRQSAGDGTLVGPLIDKAPSTPCRRR
jgi:acyl-CoA reductase-like NAD-dependent aldehyde dehydrogenase